MFGQGTTMILQRVALAVFLAAIAAIGPWAGTAHAKSRALLVAASEYADPQHRLVAPPNDAALIWNALRSRGFQSQDIRVLADRVPEDAKGLRPVGRATRAGIVSELNRLARTAQQGDTVFIYFSGHGSQQPDNDPIGQREADGLDEIFLPVDFGGWDAAARTIENAVLDDEIGTYVQRIRDAGAFVWIVFDSCHAGTMTRSLQVSAQAQRNRAIPPQLLGIPQEALDEARASARPRTRGLTTSSDANAPIQLSKRGGIVAFFAAQSGEVTYETIFPLDHTAENRRPQGLMSYHLAQALFTERAVSYRRIAQRIRAGYDVLQHLAPTPMFEGDLDLPVLGQAQAATAAWEIEVDRSGALRLIAGELQGIRKNAQVALYDARKPMSEGVVAHATVSRIGISQSALSLNGPPLRRLPTRLVGVVTQQDRAPLITVAAPPGRDRDTELVRKALQAGALGQEAMFRVVPAGEPADLYLKARAGFAWVLRSPYDPIGSRGAHLAKIPIDLNADQTQEKLATFMSSAARSRNLLRMASQFADSKATNNLSARVFVLPSGQAPGSQPQACTPPPRQIGAGVVPVNPMAIPELRHCDTMYLLLGNTGPNPIDLTILFIDSAGQIVPLPEYENGSRIEPGTSSIIVPLQIITWDFSRGQPSTVGLERVLMIGVERGPKSDRSIVVGFGHLAHGDKPRTRSLKKLDPPSEEFSKLLQSAIRPSNRPPSNGEDGVAPSSNSDDVGLMHVVRWRTRSN